LSLFGLKLKPLNFVWQPRDLAVRLANEMSLQRAA